MTTSPPVSVVVLSYNRPEMLREALASVAAQSHRSTEVIVVDNRSPRSDEVAAVTGGFPGVRLVANPDNRGFTGGMNLGLRASRGEYILLTEDDIVLDPRAIESFLADARRYPGRLTGGIMYNRTDGTVRCAGGRVRLGHRFELDIFGSGEPDRGQFGESFPVTYLPGALLFAPREVWDTLGGFRDLYYLYMEDIDLCLRAAAAGIGLAVVPSARVWHFDPPAAPPPGWLRRLKLRNFYRMYLLNAPARVLPGFLLRYVLADTARALATGRSGGWEQAGVLARVAGEMPRLIRERRRWVGGETACPRT